MEMNSITNQEKTLSGVGCECTNFLKVSTLGTFKAEVMKIMKQMRKVGEDDPRRIIHSIKVGLALTLVSLFYYLRPLYDGFGQAGMWAVLTVVVVFEFTVGGTLSKSLNRGGATLLAGALGVGAKHIAGLCGEKGEPVVLGLFVFILAATSTFMRYLPNVKKRYEYGMLIFILTFTLVAVSGVRVTHILQMAHQRLSTILIGGATCIAISIFICPVWAGQDLHNLVAANIENLAVFFQGFGVEFYSCPGEECSTVSSKDDKDCRSYLQSYKKILNSKANEESLANLAWWEPSHGRFGSHHPWKQYLNIGVLTRECACQIETLNRCINSKPLQVASEFQPTITKMSTESGKALQELASAVKNMTFPSSTVEIRIRNSKDAASDLRSILENPSFPSKHIDDLQEIMPVLVVAYVLTDILNCVEKLSVHVHELGKKAGFKKSKTGVDPEWSR